MMHPLNPSVRIIALCALSASAMACAEPAPLVPVADAAAEIRDDVVDDEVTAPVVLDDLDMTAEDFECLTRWTRVRRFYVTNKAGRLEETLAVANAPAGKTYPVGTIIQLVPFEAMVKRRSGWSPESNDWEFFALETDETGTTIISRGGAGVENQFGAECLPCHVKAIDWDMTCEQDHGCDPLTLTDFIVDSFVNNDPRCP